mmetsp:Transcript_65480/g.142874  ORF Transcript_65480/g.142874 Transcript_65480/m.142874 type:complete len:140 (-) Transcript_65480:236-655(-)
MLTTAACLEALRLSCDRQLICRGLHATVHPVGRPSLTSPGSIDTPSHFAQHNASSLPSDSRHTDSGKGDYHVGPSGVPLTPPSVALADSWAMQTKALTASLKECTEFALSCEKDAAEALEAKRLAELEAEQERVRAKVR